MEKKITEEKLREAKAKLACHIEPPKGSAFAEMLAAQQAENEQPKSDASCSTSSCSTSAVPMKDGKIRLTEMTTAGG